MRTIQFNSTICYGLPVTLEVDILPANPEKRIYSQRIHKIFLIHPGSGAEFAQSIYDRVSNIPGEWARIKNDIYDHIKRCDYIELDELVAKH